MGEILKFNGEERMNAPVLKVKESLSFIIETDYRNVEELVEASEKYDIEFPTVTYMVNCYRVEDGYQCDFYSGFECYGNMYFQFGFVEDIEMEELQSLATDTVIGCSDEMSWKEAIKMHLAESGIDYEEDNN